MRKDDKSRDPEAEGNKPADKPKRKRKTLVRKTRYMALEPRIVFDGALVADIVDNNAATEAAKTGTEAPESTLPAVDWSRTGVSNALPPEGRSSAAEAAEKAAAEARGDFSDSEFGTARADGISEILIIDGSVGSLDQLSAAARPGIEIFVLDAGRDGVEQISEILASRTGVETVHIVSHGRPGEMTLGNTKLTLESMIARESEIEGWGDHLDVGADLLLYGCEVAGGDRGDSYVDLLSRLTGADVAASTDNTGSRTQGGNWVLESNVGDVGSSFFGDDGLLTTGEILLPTTSLTSATPWTTVFTGSNYDFSGDMQAAGGADLIGSDEHGALYTNFDDKGTTGTSDDMLAFRVRLTDGGSSFSKVIFVGMDVNADGAIDAFVGVDNQGGTPMLRIWDAGTGANTSPSTTSIVTTTYSYAETTANYAFTAVSSTSDPNWNGVTDIDAGGGTDYFVSWQVSFADLSTHLGTQGISGVTKDTTIQYMFATATQNNAINSDLGGVNGGVSSSLTWGDLGAMSAPMSASNVAPVITSFGGQEAAAKAVVSGTASVATMTAIDPNSDTYSWSISGGADAARFSINPSTGALTFVSAPDYSVPVDSDGDNRYAVEVTVTDSKGAIDRQTLSVNVLATADAIAPTRTATYPTDDATGVAVNSNLSITFDEAIQAGSGSVRIYTSGGTLVTSIPISDTRQVTISGNTVYLDPGVTLAKNANYYVQYDAGVVRDLSGNNVAVLGDTTSFDFKTANTLVGDASAPILSSSTPADNDGSVARNASVVLAFSESVAPDSGYFTIYKSDGTLFERFPVTDSSRVTFNDTSVTLNPSNDFDPSSSYYVNIDSSAVQDLASNHYLGLTGSATLNFTTAANQAPVNLVPGAQTTPEDTTRVFSTAAGNALSVSDADSTFLTVSLSIANGSLTLGALSGLSFTAGDGLSDTTMTFRGTVANINAALDGLTYAPAANFAGSTSLTISTNDGLATDTDSVAVTVTAVNDAPTTVTLSAATVAENSAGATIGTLGFTDPDAGDTVSYTVSDTRFEVVSGALKLKAGESLNYEAGSTVGLTVTATDAGGMTKAQAFTITVTDVNEAPTAVTVVEVTANPSLPSNALPTSTIAEAGAATGSLTSLPPLLDARTELGQSQQFVDPSLITQPVNIAGSLGSVSAPPAVPLPSVGSSVASIVDALAPTAVGESSVASIVNALPATAAGSSDGASLTSSADQSFQVALISTKDVGDRGAQLESLTGARLFVLEGVADVQADKQYQVPVEAFAHTDASAQIRLEARQSSGAPLPSWLQFNQINGTFSGTPPDGGSAAVEVQVLAHDSQSREASVIFKLELGVAGAGTGTTGNDVAQTPADRGFALTRIGADSVTGAGLAVGSNPSLSGDRLFVLEGVSGAVGEQRYQLPQSAFAHTDAKAIVRLEARQANGTPLPAWLQFDPVSGVFRGSPPDGTSVAIDVMVVAHDGAARQASVVFKLEMGVTGADAQSPAPSAGSTETPLRQGGAPGGPRAQNGIEAQPASSSVDSYRGDALRFAETGLAAQQTAFAEASAAAGLGFPVARVPAQDMLRVSGGEGFAAAEQSLFVYQGIFAARGESQYQVPLDAFGHSDPSAIVRLEARNADGSPLPFWLHFDSLTGTFRGTPPGGQRTALEIILTARDEEGREANLEFTLELGVKIADEVPVKADATPADPQPHARADGEDGEGEKDPDAVAADAKDGVDGGKDKLEKGKPVRVGSAPFGEQIKVAKAARDPVLAKILGENVKPGGRPI